MGSLSSGGRARCHWRRPPQWCHLTTCRWYGQRSSVTRCGGTCRPRACWSVPRSLSPRAFTSCGVKPCATAARVSRRRSGCSPTRRVANGFCGDKASGQPSARQRPFVGWPATGHIRPLGRLRLHQTALFYDLAMLDCLRQNRRRTLIKISMRFDQVDLRLLRLVVEAASITHGAARADMALASASERIRLMEDSLGAPLLERNRPGVRATPAGSALVHHAHLVIQQLELMRAELSEYAEGLRGWVRLFANTTATAEFLAAALGAFLSLHPQIDIDLEERSSREIVRAVAQNLAEVGIVGDEVNPAKELQTFPFAEDWLVLIAPSDDVVSRRRTIGFREALDYDYVGLTAGHALQEQMQDHAARAGRRLKLHIR